MSRQETDLGKDSIGRLLFKLATPAIIAQLVNVLYNIVDRMFIGKLPDGETAIAGIGVAFPVIMLISACSALIGMGGAPLAAIKMGEKDNEGAEKIVGTSFSLLLVISVLLTGGLLLFCEDILWKFGANSATIKPATEYLSIYLLGTVAVQIALGMNPFINTQGFAKTGMLTVGVGAVINIVLDPILIFGFGMGVKGAALATIIAQFVSAIWVLWFFFGKEKTFKNAFFTEVFGKKTIIKIRKKFFKPNASIALKIVGLGVAPFIMQATESLVMISLNKQLLYYGNMQGENVATLAIGATAIMASIMQIINLPIIGLTQGAQPIISYNYGAKKFERVKKTFKMLLVCCLTYTTLMWLALNTVPEVFVKMFNNKPEFLEITSWSIGIFFAGIFIIGAQIACQQTFLALGQAKISLFLALLRKVILLIPLIYILPLVVESQYQLGAIFAAEPVADVIASLTTLVCFGIFYKKTLSKIDDVEMASVQTEQV